MARSNLLCYGQHPQAQERTGLDLSAISIFFKKKPVRDDETLEGVGANDLSLLTSDAIRVRVRLPDASTCAVVTASGTL